MSIKNVNFNIKSNKKIINIKSVGLGFEKSNNKIY